MTARGAATAARMLPNPPPVAQRDVEWDLMLLNRLWEGVRALSSADRRLARRGREPGARRPVVLVPGMCGSRLTDGRGRFVWGTTSRLYVGGPFAARSDLRVAGLLRELRLVPGLLAYDIFGGFVRAFGRAGFVEDEDLFVLAYDWRAGVVAAAAALANLVDRIRGLGHDSVDLVAISTAGLVVRTYLGFGGADPLAADGAIDGIGPAPTGAGARHVRRAIYVCAAQQGSFDSLACLHRGFRFAPGGKTFSAAETGACQTAWDALPHPDERLFVGRDGEPLPIDHFDPLTWARFSLGDCGAVPGWTGRLDRARRLWRALDRTAALPLPDSLVIGTTHLPTPARILVDGARARVPLPVPAKGDSYAAIMYQPGDGELTELSLRGVPGLPSGRILAAPPRKHAALVSDPVVHRMVIEALLATDLAPRS